MQLAALAERLPRQDYDPTVVVFYSGGGLESRLATADVPILSVGKSGRWDNLGFASRLIRLLRSLEPAVVHSYLGPSNVFSAAVRTFLPKTRLIWGIRASDMELDLYDWTWRFTFAAERMLSNFPDIIVSNSHAGRDHVVCHGFPPDRITVIPNGIDTVRFRPDPSIGRELRQTWLRNGDKFLVALPARLDPMKDHVTLLRAAAILRSEGLAVRFVCVGNSQKVHERNLVKQAMELGLEDSVLWIGHHQNMNAVYNAVDVVTLCSAFGEGFPNAVGEAMACGLSCVVTDVGDSAEIVGDTGIVVNRRNPGALAAALRQQLALSCDRRVALGVRARQRIEQMFAVETMVDRTTQLYDSLLRESGKISNSVIH